MTIIYFLIALGLLIFIHELGHFLMAKRRGIGVEKFSLGFGPKIFGMKRGETEYRISLLPLGGYVKLKGEDPEGTDSSDPASYSGRPPAHRFWVVFSGPAMNLILALVLMPVIFMIGRKEPVYWGEAAVVQQVKRGTAAETSSFREGDRILEVDGQKIENWRDLIHAVALKSGKNIAITFDRGGRSSREMIPLGAASDERGAVFGIEPYLFIGTEAIADGVLPESPAAQAGFQAGDEVVRIQGKEVLDWDDMSQRISNLGGEQLAFQVRREGRFVTLLVTPRQEKDRWVIGIQKDYEKRGPPVVLRRYSFFPAIQMGMQETSKLSLLTLTVLKKLVTLQLSYKSLGGPIRIAQVSAAAARSGLSDFLYLLAFLSLQLGIMNLLPIPVLDGGHIFFIGIELLIRRPVPAKVRLVAEQAGFVLLVSLMALVTLHDIDSVWGFSKILEQVRHLLRI